MASSSSKRPRKSRKGKEQTTEIEDPTFVRPSVAKVLDQRRFFSDSHQMEHYVADFYTRNIVVPKIMNFESFAGSGLYFQHHLLFQGVVEFLTLVNNVWQHDIGDDEDKEQPQHHDNPVQPPPHLSNPNMMTQMWEGVQDLQHRM
ncbi:hypothetical protein LR48_Vigan11g095400 [Vigna angularis]|uniref:Uncharacterized protein n=1 Tax=Phaseolus angularis TaxID=3914 RepID=A0A0L9VS67_PHAAN|nr:hypothetical protein LR48_Vigan11g095400 [Vigna angularis]